MNSTGVPSPVEGDSDGRLIIAVVGDVFIDRVDPTEPLRRARPILLSTDVALANSEGVYARHGARPPSAAHQVLVEPDNAVGVQFGGFDAVSCANNHTLDGGYGGLTETLETLHGLGIQTAGAGPDIAAAHRPAILEARGQRIALLAYCSTFPIGYDAREGVPGIAVLRVDTVYAPPDPHFWAPGAEPRVITRPWPEDIAAMECDITRARQTADVVVVSMHWGESFVPLRVQDYERVLGRAAVDAGADVVFGHHHHSLRGVEIYENAPIFYGLGNFSFDFRDIENRWSPTTLQGFQQRYGEYAFGPREGYPAFPFHPDYRLSAIGVVEMIGGAVGNVGLIPCVVRPDGPEPLAVGHPDRQAVVDYLRRATDGLGRMTDLLSTGGGELAGIEACAVKRRASLPGWTKRTVQL